MLEFLAAAEVSSVFGPSVGPMLGRVAGVVVGKQLGTIVQERVARKKAEQACAEALQEWLVAVIRDFKECGLKDDDLKHFFRDYIESIDTFLQDDEVSGELLRPFTEPVPDPALGGRLLVDRWQALSLPPLPEGFNAERACRWYVERLNQTRQAIEILRPFWHAQADQRRNELLRDIRGQWSDWNLDHYADAMRETYQALDITTLQLTGHYDLDAEPIKLRDVFIAQHARRSLSPRILPRDYLEKLRGEVLEDALAADALLDEHAEANSPWDKTPREPVLDILTGTNIRHLVILGDPGAGKSCLARYVTLSVLDGLELGHCRLDGPLPLWVARLAGRVPFLIELRRFLTWEVDDGEAGFVGYLHHLGSDRGFGLNRADLDRHLRTAPSLVIFDGLDEVLERRKRDAVADAITGFARTYPAARIVVTARGAGFDQRPFTQRASGFTIATLDELDQEQIEAFSKTWFTLTLRADPEQAEIRHRHLVRSVQERPQLRTLAGNPLLLTVIALIARRQELPPARATLYAHALQVFCHHWDFEDKQLELPPDSPLRDLDVDDKLAVLRQIAWSMLEKEALRANAIEKEDLESVIRSYFETELWPTDKAMCRRASRQMIQVLEQRNYVLCQQGDGLFGFVHRTLLEYLSASQILWRIEKDRDLSIDEACKFYVLAHCEDDGWREVIRLLAAQLQPRDAVALAASLINRPIQRGCGSSVAASLTLGIDCLGERKQRERRYFATLMRRVAEYARGNGDPDVRSAVVKALGKHFAVDPEVREVLLDLASKENVWSVRHTAILTIGEYAASDRQIRELLIEWMIKESDEDVRHVATSALAMHIASDLEIRELLFELASKHRDVEVRGRLIFQFGLSLGDDPAIRGLLMRALGDEVSTVRLFASLVLQRYSEDDPEIRQALIESAINGDDATRGVVVSGLARLVESVPEIRGLLIEWASKEDNPDLRRAAVTALGENAAGDTEIRGLLIERASKDDDAKVRRAAVAALGNHAAGDPEIRGLLIEWATKEDDADVRRAAIAALGDHAASDPEIRGLLIDRVCNEDDAAARRAAVAALGNHAASDPEIRGLLIEWATKEDDADVRRAAMAALGYHAVSDPEIRGLLIDWATKEDDADARRAAIAVFGGSFAQAPNVHRLLKQVSTIGDPKLLQLLGAHFVGDPEIRGLLIERASKEDDVSVRGAAVAALGIHSAGDAEIRSLLIERASKEDDADVRRAAIGSWITGSGDQTFAVLLSEDLDAVAPWIDTRGMIDAERVAKAAERLRLDEDEVRSIYERLAAQLRLALEWSAPSVLSQPDSCLPE